MRGESRLTLVSALFDLASREPDVNRRNAPYYLEAAEWLAGVDQDMVLFADPGAAGELRRLRDERGLGHRTEVVARPFERTEAHARIGRIAAAREARPLRNANPAKDTPLYTALTWAKLELAAEVARRDPFGATHVAWIDIGIPGRPHPDDDVFAATPAGLRLLQMRPFAAASLAPTPEYLDYLRGHVAGAYLAAPRELWEPLAQRFTALADGLLADGLTGSEEQLLPLLAAEERAPCEFHYGDYPAILLNFVRARSSAGNLLFQLRTARDEGRFDAGHAIGAWLLPSVLDGALDCDGATLAALLDECFLAAYYACDPDRSPATRIAALFAERVGRDHRFRDWFLLNEIRVRRNFELLGERAPQP